MSDLFLGCFVRGVDECSQDGCKGETYSSADHGTTVPTGKEILYVGKALDDKMYSCRCW